MKTFLLTQAVVHPNHGIGIITFVSDDESFQVEYANFRHWYQPFGENAQQLEYLDTPCDEEIALRQHIKDKDERYALIASKKKEERI